MAETKALVDLLMNVAVPLVTLDNAELYVVSANDASVHLHLGGAYAGCPGNVYVERDLLAPLVREVFPKATLRVSSALPIPAGAQALRPASSGPAPLP